jgi:hypothetical protein
MGGQAGPTVAEGGGGAGLGRSGGDRGGAEGTPQVQGRETLAIFDLDLSATEEAVTAIQGRATEVYRLTKLIAGVSEEAGARVLTGALAIQAIDSATAAISSFRQLRDELSSSKAKDEKAIAAEIEQVLIAIQNLRNKLENP